MAASGNVMLRQQRSVASLILLFFASLVQAQDNIFSIGGPPDFPDLEAIFHRTLSLESKFSRQIQELHQELKLNGSTPEDGDDKKCDCGYVKYMEDTKNSLNEARRGNVHIEPYCPIITTLPETTTAETTIAETTVAHTTVAPTTKRLTTKRPVIIPTPSKTVPPPVPPGYSTEEEALSSTTVPLVPLTSFGTTVNATFGPDVFTTVGPAIGTSKLSDGMDTVLIAVLGGVIALLLIIMTMFFCRYKRNQRFKHQFLQYLPTQKKVVRKSGFASAEEKTYGSTAINGKIVECDQRGDVVREWVSLQ